MSLAKLVYNGQEILASEKKEYINATQMAAGFGKQPKDWLRLSSTNNLMRKIAKRTECNLNDLFYAFKGGKNNKEQGTWIHPDLVENYNNWLMKNKDAIRKTTGVIYIFADNGNDAYKVGFTTDLYKREKQHRTANPFLELVKVYENQTIESETMIHEKLTAFRIKGTTEWYVKCSDVLKTIKLLLQDVNN